MYLSNSFNTKKISLKSTVHTLRSKEAFPHYPVATNQSGDGSMPVI